MASKKKHWSDDDMRKALSSCKDDGMSIYAAAKQHGIPRMTLSDRVLGKVAINAQIGHPTALSMCDWLLHYITYMHERRFPIDRSQLIALAWAIDLKREPEKRVFDGQGRSLHWWRGFRDRHPQLGVRKGESIDRGRVANVDHQIIDKYFDVLQETLDTQALHDRPHLIFNCDESAIHLSKTSRKVVVPRKSKHAHTMTNATTQHVSVLCCVAAAGTAIPPWCVWRRWDESPVPSSPSARCDPGDVDPEEIGGIPKKTRTRWRRYQRRSLCHIWRFLKTRVDGQQAKPLIVAPTPVDEHPLLKAGLIPKRLVDVFTTPPEKQTGLRMRRGATTKARVLTSDATSNEIREGDTERKLAQTEKEHKKKIRLLKKTQKPPRQTTRRTRKAKPAGATATSVATAAHSATDRHDYFASIQGLLVNCRSTALVCVHEAHDPRYIPLSVWADPTIWDYSAGHARRRHSRAVTITSHGHGNIDNAASPRVRRRQLLPALSQSPLHGERQSPHGDARENCERAAAARWPVSGLEFSVPGNW